MNNTPIGKIQNSDSVGIAISEETEKDSNAKDDLSSIAKKDTATAIDTRTRWRQFRDVGERISCTKWKYGVLAASMLGGGTLGASAAYGLAKYEASHLNLNGLYGSIPIYYISGMGLPMMAAGTPFNLNAFFTTTSGFLALGGSAAANGEKTEEECKSSMVKQFTIVDGIGGAVGAGALAIRWAF